MLGEKIKEIRIGLGLTMKDFGKKFDPVASDSIVSRWERGISVPSVSRLSTIANLGGIEVVELVSQNIGGNNFKFNSKISYELNSEVPILMINDEAVGVVSMTRQFVTKGMGEGVNIITFTYLTKNSPKQRVLFINHSTGEVFEQ
ncbi:helix-turn-helix domain-containing protein [Vagococcus vulneris]